MEAKYISHIHDIRPIALIERAASATISAGSQHEPIQAANSQLSVTSI